jgi:hypothetical protein
MISKKVFFVAGIIAIVALSTKYLVVETKSINKVPKDLTILLGEDEEIETKNSIERAKYDWLLMQDPKTGKVPDNIRAKEMAWIKTMPVRKNGLFNRPQIQQAAFGNNDGFALFGETNNYLNSQAGNTYLTAGPTQNGGRTRALSYDMRYGTGTNKIILAGGINGGIFRSTDGGVNWKFVHPSSEIRSVSCFAQDPINKNIWYAGTGEAIGASSGYPAGFVYGNGMFKSEDEGATWTKLTSTNVPDPTAFSSEWCFVYKISVHPTTGHIYAAVHRRVVRSTDAGATWKTVFASKTAATGIGGVGDLIINKNGSKIFVAMSGRNADRSLSGIFTSTTGDTATFTRIAGGVQNSADSVAGWRAYDNTPNTAGTDYIAGWGRTTIALAPSNQNLLYALVENTDEAAKSKPEADLYKCDMSTSTFAWTKLTDNLTAKRILDGATTEKYFEAQGGYNMLLAIHPTNDKIMLVGGVNLFRSTDGFATKDNVTFAGGVGSETYTDADDISHADFHSFSFDPTDPKRVLIGSDGGLGFIKDISVTSPEWSNANGQYQSIQYYHVGIDPTPGSRVFYGGAQDNSTTFRDRQNSPILQALPDSNDHFILLGGDGCQVGMSKKNSALKQHLFAAAQSGQFYRINLYPPYDAIYNKIKPSSAGEGEFITYFHLDPDNTDYLYYASDDSIFRTNDATNVTASGWTLMTGIAPNISGNIYSMATTRGAYNSNSHLFIGTSDGKLYRLRDPQGTSEGTAPTNITPSSMTVVQSGFQAPVITDIAINPRNQDTVVMVVSNYNVNSIFWTGNATAAQPTWQVIEGNLSVPSVRSCEIVVKTTGVEYYVGTSTGLFSTASVSGNSTVWAREVGVPGQPSEMMNTAIVSSLAYRWTDNTLLVGTHGNGMFAAYIGSPVSVVTAVTNPIRDNSNFVKVAYPTLMQNELNYQVGNMFSMKKISVQLTSMNGSIVYRNEAGYQNGRIPVSNLAAGTYVLTITSPDRKYQYTKKFIKN